MDTSSPGGARQLLARLREVMAAEGAAEDRLHQIVSLIASHFGAEVCSCYAMRAGEVLELFATQGLKRTAIHRTRLRVGEGVVGDVAAHARPVAVADAQRAPQFAYRPETGEDPYHGFAGVPLLRDGRVLGVLAVQHRAQRRYSDAEIEMLQTVAMVVTEILSSGHLVAREELSVSGDGNGLLPLRLEGIRLNPGLAMGEVVLHRPRVVVHQVVADDTEAERERLRMALTTMQAAVDALVDGVDGDQREVLEAYAMFARDAGWIRRIEERVNNGLTAEAAVMHVRDEMRRRFIQIKDPYLAERRHDLEDLSHRLLQHLAGEEATAAAGALPDHFILVAETMGPAELLDYPRWGLRGLVLAEGSPASHVAIVARALDIPVVGRCPEVVARVDAGETVVVDGDNGQVFLRPTEEVQEQVADHIRARLEQRTLWRAQRSAPALTLDGTRVHLRLNAGMLVDLPQLAATGAEGIGLYRTELAFMVRDSLPNVDEQTALYTRVMDQAGTRPVVFRTLDVGSDKLLPYWDAGLEDNPAMGWRSTRITLDRPAVLRTQLRALVRAAAGRDLYVMFPMITHVSEFDAARRLLEREMEAELARGHRAPERVRVGTMLEVPSLALQLPDLLRRVDFLSVGSNDLFQFLFAVDRGNPRVSDRYDMLSTGVMRWLRDVVRAADHAAVPLSVCGEAAGRPVEALALMAVGVRTLSMAGPAVGPVKAMVCSLDLGAATLYMDTLLQGPERHLRSRLLAYARDHGVQMHVRR